MVNKPETYSTASTPVHLYMTYPKQGRIEPSTLSTSYPNYWVTLHYPVDVISGDGWAMSGCVKKESITKPRNRAKPIPPWFGAKSKKVK